ncbi:hypothetical protein JOQ06_020224 [Pogonophryne albipinna]|uniref:C1q domain-containing protein n=1 Tax=Pogonophryne albipinna TaxID=1090488 RepID=A0AAD6FWM4_9TELE|nr:hypothetical protein JOQ06_020224 [Pogonophryne albipinna]
MSLTILLIVSLFCGLISAQDDGNTTTLDYHETEECYPDMCNLLREFGAVSEKLRVLETRMEDSETRLMDTETQLKDTETRLKDTETRLKDTKMRLMVTETRLTESENQILELKKEKKTVVFSVFFAPVAGVYYFTIFFHAGGDHEAKLMLYKNNDIVFVTHDHRSRWDCADNGGNAVFLQLVQGDQVYVRLIAKTYVWGTFSGFLVNEM